MPFFELSSDYEIASEQTSQAIKTSVLNSCPVAIIIPKGVFESYHKPATTIFENGLTREMAIITVAKELNSKTVLVVPQVWRVGNCLSIENHYAKSAKPIF